MNTKYLIIHSNGEMELRDGDLDLPHGTSDEIARMTAVFRVRQQLESISLDVRKCRPNLKLTINGKPVQE